MTAVAIRSRRGAVEPTAAANRGGVLRRAGTRGGGLAAAVVVLAVLGCVSVAYGSKSIALGTVWDAFASFDGTREDHVIVRELRVPRTVLGLEIGAALGLAGAVMQGLTRNPLADPSILGIQSGAALGVVLAISTFGIGSLTGYVWFGFVGAAIAGVVVYTLGSLGRGGATPVKLALAGAAVMYLLVSITTAIELSDFSTLQQSRFFVVGSLVGRDTAIAGQVFPFLAVGAVLALGLPRSLNAMALGDDVARSLGQRVYVTRAVSGLSVVLLAGAATAAAGPIVFVGLTVPHMARAICGPDYRWVLPWTVVLSPMLLLAADVLGRVVARPAELQVGIVTAVLGAPFFVALVRRGRVAEL